MHTCHQYLVLHCSVDLWNSWEAGPFPNHPWADKVGQTRPVNMTPTTQASVFDIRGEGCVFDIRGEGCDKIAFRAISTIVLMQAVVFKIRRSIHPVALSFVR
jgi:hypothetical protein